MKGALSFKKKRMLILFFHYRAHNEVVLKIVTKVVKNN